MNKALVLFGVFFTTFISLPASAESENVWKIGMPVCLSGDCAADGKSSLNGALLAAKEINKKGMKHFLDSSKKN